MKIKKLGNAECTQCGLRACSKNVAIRSVFACWPDNDDILSIHECIVKITSKDDLDYVRVYSTDDGEWAENLAKWFKVIYDHNPGEYQANVKKLLCCHTWIQDPGTATV